MMTTQEKIQISKLRTIQVQEVIHLRKMIQSGTYWCEMTIDGVGGVFATNEVKVVVTPKEITVSDIRLTIFECRCGNNLS